MMTVIWLIEQWKGGERKNNENDRKRINRWRTTTTFNQVIINNVFHFSKSIAPHPLHHRQNICNRM